MIYPSGVGLVLCRGLALCVQCLCRLGTSYLIDHVASTAYGTEQKSYSKVLEVSRCDLGIGKVEIGYADRLEKLTV